MRLADVPLLRIDTVMSRRYPTLSSATTGHGAFPDSTDVMAPMRTNSRKLAVISGACLMVACLCIVGSTTSYDKSLQTSVRGANLRSVGSMSTRPMAPRLHRNSGMKLSRQFITPKGRDYDHLHQLDIPSDPLGTVPETVVQNEERCPGCGRVGGPNWGCNGKGNQLGGFALVVPWWPIKVYRPCPEFLAYGGEYYPAGQGVEEILFGSKKKDAGAKGRD
ncbi:hypothetical protein AAMO2058_000507700 [Amorphochlora amoebiformis]